MIEDESHNEKREATRPECFLVTSADDVHTIEHQRVKGGLNSCLSLWLAGWTICCICLLIGYFTGMRMDDGNAMSLDFVMVFLFAWFCVACWLLYLTAARKFFRLERDALQIVTRTLSLSWTVTIPRNSIVKLRQVKDGGEGEDTFPSWGLRIECTDVDDVTLQCFVPSWLYRIMTTRLVPFPRKPSNHMRSLLRRQPYEQSRWLGIAIAKWAGVEVKLLPRPAHGPN
ncbi:MAG: hypothetical protein AB8G99_02515 [Planctomycetaceae bacterium]